VQFDVEYTNSAFVLACPSPRDSSATASSGGYASCGIAAVDVSGGDGAGGPRPHRSIHPWPDPDSVVVCLGAVLCGSAWVGVRGARRLLVHFDRPGQVQYLGSEP
jgi:hypothetical protein